MHYIVLWLDSDVLVLPIHNMLHQRSITVTIQLDYPAHYEAAEDHIRYVTILFVL